MSDLLKRSIWFGRLVLGAGALLFTQLGLSNTVGPIAVAGRTHTTLGSPDAITVVRVQGGVFIGIAVVLAHCLASEMRSDFATFPISPQKLSLRSTIRASSMGHEAAGNGGSAEA